jgi:DNA-binding NarL/FixJ family response regulator
MPPITVAIVEDDPRIRRSLQAILEQDAGLECVGTFASAEEALSRLPVLKPKVILMDVMLPGMNGVSCIKGLGGKDSGAHIIMLTVREDADILFESLAAGASGYLLKPPSAAQLLEAVHDVFAGGAPMTSSIARKVVQSFTQTKPSSREAENLSAREIEVLELLVRGLAYKEVAAELGISYSTVHRHIESIYRKLHVHSRSHAIAKYLGA